MVGYVKIWYMIRLAVMLWGIVSYKLRQGIIEVHNMV